MTTFQRFNIDNTSDNDDCLINYEFYIARGRRTVNRGRDRNLQVYSKSFRIARLSRINRDNVQFNDNFTTIRETKRNLESHVRKREQR